MRPIWARRRDAAAFHLGPPRLGQPEIQGSQQTLRWREMDSNFPYRVVGAPPASLLIRCYTERIPRGAQQGLFPRA